MFFYVLQTDYKQKEQVAEYHPAFGFPNTRPSLKEKQIYFVNGAGYENLWPLGYTIKLHEEKTKFYKKWSTMNIMISHK